MRRWPDNRLDHLFSNKRSSDRFEPAFNLIVKKCVVEVAARKSPAAPWRLLQGRRQVKHQHDLGSEPFEQFWNMGNCP